MQDNPPTVSAQRYSTVAIVLHWLIAALLALEIAIGLRMDAAHGAVKFAAFQLHKSIGITILLLVLLRIVWRCYRVPPPLAVKGYERVLARLVHGLFYVLLLALPLSGWIVVSTSRITVPTLLYGAIPWPHVPILAQASAVTKAAWNSAGELVHVSLGYLIYGLIAAHVAGALKHHFIDRSDDLARIVPGARAGAWFEPRLLLIVTVLIAAAVLGSTWPPAKVATAQSPTAPPETVRLNTNAPKATVPQSPAVAAAAADDEAAAEPTNSMSAAVAPAEIPSWSIGAGSAINFKTSWSDSPITGGFAKFDGDIDFDPDQLERSKVRVSIHLGSVDSGDEQRDSSLLGPDWFDTTAHEVAVFEAHQFRRVDEKHFIAKGSLKLKGATLPLSLPFTLEISGKTAVMRGSAVVDRIRYGVGTGTATSEIPAAVQVNVTVHATRK